MRTREQIEKSIPELLSKSNMVEVLLDIRDLLVKIEKKGKPKK